MVWFRTKKVAMSKRPKAPKRPADDGKNKAAQSLGRRGGNARAKALTAQQRTDGARKAAKARWDR
jgi:hypothetical protein